MAFNGMKLRNHGYFTHITNAGVRKFDLRNSPATKSWERSLKVSC